MYIVFVMMCIEVHVLYVVHVKPRSKCLIIVVRNKFKNMSKPLSLRFSSPELKNSGEFFCSKSVCVSVSLSVRLRPYVNLFHSFIYRPTIFNQNKLKPSLGEEVSSLLKLRVTSS